MSNAAELLFQTLSLTCRKITLNDYRTRIRIGAYDHERRAAQPVSVTVELWVTYRFGEQKRLDEVYDYTLITHTIEEVAAAGHIDLQEDLVDQVITALMADDRVRAVRVRTAKPQACDAAESLSVETFRPRTSSNLYRPTRRRRLFSFPFLRTEHSCRTLNRFPQLPKRPRPRRRARALPLPASRP